MEAATDVLEGLRSTIRRGPDRRDRVDSYYDWIHKDVSNLAVELALRAFFAKQGRLPTTDEAKSAGFLSGYVSAWVTTAMFVGGVSPLLRQLRRYTILLTSSLICLTGAGTSLWAVGDAASFRTFAAIFFPGVIGVGLSAAKAWKTWAEGKKALAEARKIERELADQSASGR
jgi:hypothetical protein